MNELLISEPIQPVPGTFDTTFMSGGVPGLPRAFRWRGLEYVITQIIRVWRTTGPCDHGSTDQYTRRHWFEVKTEAGVIMKIYFDKGPHGKRNEMGWHLFSVQTQPPEIP